MRHTDGVAGSRTWQALDARPVLGLPTVWSPFLVDLSAARSREGQANHRVSIMKVLLRTVVRCQDGNDDDLDDDDEDFDEADESDQEDDDEEDQDDDEDEPETWQVLGLGHSL